MFKNQEDQISVLGICVEDPAAAGRTEGLNFCSVRSGRRAIDMLRMLSFDLVLVGMRIPDLGTWDMVRRLRTGWANQKWALIGGAITEQQEITARMFGPLKIYDVMPSSDELLQLADAIRQKAAMSVLNQDYNRNFRLPTGPSNSAIAL